MSVLLEVQQLKTVLNTPSGPAAVVSDASFSLQAGETFALLGESGSGKSMTALSILQLLPKDALFGKESRILFQGQDLLNLREHDIRQIRGKEISIIFQEPMTSLNPVMTIGDQIAEVLKIHQGMKGSALKMEAKHLLELVQIKDAERIYRSYAHHLSGGMRQRAMIAMALAGRPKLLIADEPTTALDVTTQAQIIELLQKLQQEFGMAILFITHDIKLASKIAMDVAIMKSGRIVEYGNCETVLQNPKDPYTRQLLDARPKEKKAILSMEAAEVLKVEQLNVLFPIKKGLLRRTTGVVPAVVDVSFNLKKGETLALVGESGSGKTTLGKTIASLIQKTSGTIRMLDEDLDSLSSRQLRARRREFQIIFQDPFSAMDPRMRIRNILMEGMQALNIGSDVVVREQRLDLMLKDVGLSSEYKLRYPHELSGGQRQRICIARALCVGPKLLILDEPTSNLDVSVQAQILDLLLRLQKEFDLSYLFITHNMSIVEAMSHTVAVLKEGRVVEYGSTEKVLKDPEHPYTRKLLAAQN